MISGQLSVISDQRSEDRGQRAEVGGQKGLERSGYRWIQTHPLTVLTDGNLAEWGSQVVVVEDERTQVVLPAPFGPASATTMGRWSSGRLIAWGAWSSRPGTAG